jgi:hypothetical protein
MFITLATGCQTVVATFKRRKVDLFGFFGLRENKEDVPF